MYLDDLLAKYQPRDLGEHTQDLVNLKSILRKWANTCYLEILDSGSRAKGTAIHLASDVDFLVSLTSDCNSNNGGLASIYNSLYAELKTHYNSVRRQNVSIRVTINGLEVDVTPARRQPSSRNFHWLYVSKTQTRQQTNIQQHINDVSASGRTKEIKIMKIWRERHNLEIPSIYLEYLMIQKILRGRSTNSLANNVLHTLKELARDSENPIYSRVVDPANSSNILSNSITNAEKARIIHQASISAQQQYWRDIVW